MNSLLITGATGSIGRELVRQALLDGVPRICVFSRDEHKQAEMRQEYPDMRLRWFVGDVRDRDRLRRAFEGMDTVIHAAALKRVEVGEYDAHEMVKTNVVGTMNVIEAAHDAGVKRVIALSTDKACYPVSAYGASKLLMEKIVLAANNASGDFGPRFAVTRFGNFAGSRGSVIPQWLRAKAFGAECVPITDIRCTRFWMTAKQAVDLVMNTAHTMKGGELIIPLLPAFNILDLATAMELATYEIGLRPGESLHEMMREGESSEHARMMGIGELKEALRELA